MKNVKQLEFKTLDGRSFVGRVKDGSATLGSVAGKIAAKAGLAGYFEMIDQQRPDVTLDPKTKLEDLPETTIVMAPELTPA